MTEEADFAMLYAEERRMRMELEDRMYSMICDVQPFLIASTDMVYDLLDADMEAIASHMKNIITWGGEVNLNLAYNTLFPVGEPLAPLEGIDITKMRSIGDLPRDRLEALIEIMKAAADRVEAKWVAHGLCSRNEVKRAGMRAFESAFRKVRDAHKKSKKPKMHLVPSVTTVTPE